MAKKQPVKKGKAKKADVPPAPRYEWPEKKEKRQLFVDLKPEELAIASRRLAETVPHIQSLEAAAKASAAQHKSGIQAAQVEQNQLSLLVTQKKEERPVECEWIFETAGFDSATNKPIPHPEKKTLVRLDTGAVVEIRDILQEERQMSLLPEENEEKPADEPQV